MASLFDNEPPPSSGTGDYPPPLARELARAREKGEAEAERCEAAAERKGWDPAAAGEFILAWLRKNGPTAGEVLVTEASKTNAPHDGRAFGAVFQRLARRGLIEKCGTAQRTKGNGTAGGLVWRLKVTRLEPEG